MTIDYNIVPETPAFDAEILALHDTAFGPGQYTRAAYRIREQGPHCHDHSFVALTMHNRLAGSVRMTPILVGISRGWLLGPLCVADQFKKIGIGRKLIAAALANADEQNTDQFVLLVGDAPYYGPMGFEPIPPNQVKMPGPVDPTRLLVHQPASNASQEPSGLVRHVNFG